MMTIFGLSVIKFLARALYACLKTLPTQRKVVLISRLSDEPSIDFRLLDAYLSHHHPDFQVIVLNHRMRKKSHHALQILKELYHLATSQACVVESYVISVSIFRHKRRLIVVQMWHALGALKQFGHMSLDRPEGSDSSLAQAMHMHENYTYVLAGAPATVPIFAKAFNVPESIIRPIGMPRVDYLRCAKAHETERNAFSTLWPGLSDKPVVIYAPTFRKGKRPNFGPLFKAFSFETHNLLIACHKRDERRLKDIPAGAFIAPAGRVIEFLPLADALITDYSATAIEAAFLRIPTYFWVHDIQSYTEKRGLTIPFTSDELGGSPISPKIGIIMAALRRGDHDPIAWDEFARRHVAVTDGTCTEQLVDLLELSA